MLISIGVSAEPNDRYSQCVTMFSGPSGIAMHRVLAFSVGGDGSLYFTLMKPDDRLWMVGHAPPKQEFLSRDVDTSKIVPEGTTSAPKVSFHTSGAVKFGEFRAYRPPLRTISRLEQLCLFTLATPDSYLKSRPTSSTTGSRRKGIRSFPRELPSQVELWRHVFLSHRHRDLSHTSGTRVPISR